MITVSKFLDGVQEIINSKPVYKSGKDGSKGECDCIGLIIGAIRRAGGVWKGTHGSNYAARYETIWTDKLESGGVVYKFHNPEDPGWGLPSAYSADKDPKDYYHVGVVVSISPLKIAHCTSWSGGSGIKIDTAMGNWKKSGRLKKVDYNAITPQYQPENEGETMKAYINLPADKNVFLRIKPNQESDWYARIPGQSEIEMVSVDNGWVRARWGKHDGYIMSEFVVPAETDIPFQDSLTGEQRAMLEQARDLINRLLGA